MQSDSAPTIGSASATRPRGAAQPPRVLVVPVVPDEEPDRQTGDRFEHGRRRADVIAGDEVRIAERAQVGRRRSGGRERLLADPSDAMRVQRAPVRIETALKRTFDRGNAARFADEPAASARARAWRAWRPPSAGVRRCSVRTRRVHAKMVVDPAPHGYRSNAPRRNARGALRQASRRARAGAPAARGSRLARAERRAGGRGQKFSCNACRFRRNPFVVTIERARASGALDR